ncbi:ABC transporter permease subunit [Aeromonas schubertii]|uniref:ABC transporter permease subunit n=1 Tax=Aeromonas schubertii TaxID=652 RepID=A0ABS7V6F1_9GAMM|nr:ABC transporter permease subunit [Aeromonas schubertii]MBZ6064962.1 ABC transporter permease subunit [Aeromonas schubertii]
MTSHHDIAVDAVTIAPPVTVKVGRPARRWLPFVWLLPFAALFLLFQVAPLVWVLVGSLQTPDGVGLAHYRAIWDSPFYRQSFGNSLKIGLWSSLLGLAIATLGAAALRHSSERVRRVMLAFVTMTGNFSGVPLAFAFIIVLGVNGALTLLLRQWGVIEGFNLYSGSGLILIYTYFQIPLALLLLYPAFDALQDDWHDAAVLLGASRARYVWHVALPVLTPALLATFIILLANAVGAYASAYALTTGNFNLVTIRIASLVSGDIFLEPNLAAALAVWLMAALTLVTALNQWLIRRAQRFKEAAHG